jgi:hypothetical protein
MKREMLSSWTSSISKMGPTGWPETSVHNYHSTLSNIPKKIADLSLFHFVALSSFRLSFSSPFVAQRTAEERVC